jgi:hypothetical protein
MTMQPVHRHTLWYSETEQLSYHIRLEQVPDGSIERFLNVERKIGNQCEYCTAIIPISVRTETELSPLVAETAEYAAVYRVLGATFDPSPACLVQSLVTGGDTSDFN